MNVCEHERNCVVVYDGLKCPLCDAKEENEDLTQEIKQLESEEN